MANKVSDIFLLGQFIKTVEGVIVICQNTFLVYLEEDAGEGDAVGGFGGGGGFDE